MISQRILIPWTRLSPSPVNRRDMESGCLWLDHGQTLADNWEECAICCPTINATSNTAAEYTLSRALRSVVLCSVSAAHGDLCLWASIKTYMLTPKHTCMLTLSVAQCGWTVAATVEYYTTRSLGPMSHQNNNCFKGAHKTFRLQLGPGTQSHWAWLLTSCLGNLDQNKQTLFLAARWHLRMKRGWNACYIKWTI